MPGVSIDIGANSRDFVRAVGKDMPDALEDVVDGLEDVTKAGDKAGDKIEAGMRDAQRATSKQEDALRDLVKQTKKADDANDDYRKSSKRTFEESGSAVAEFKDEARQNFSEVVSSFDGSMDSVADLAQGTLGGLAGSIAGPVGLAAGAGAAVLGGMFTSMTTAATEASEESAERVDNMVDDMLESGQRFASESLIREAMKDIVKDADKLKDVERRANIAGVSVQTALRAQAGDKDAISTAIDAATRSLDGLIASGASASSYQVRETQKVIDGYKALQGDISTAAGRVDLITQASTTSAAALSNADVKAQGLRATLDAMPASKKMTVDVDVDGAMRRLDRISQRSLEIVVTGKTRAGDRVF